MRINLKNKKKSKYKGYEYKRICKRCESSYSTFSKNSSFCENCNLNINRDKRKDKNSNTLKLNINWRDIQNLGKYKREVLKNG